MISEGLALKQLQEIVELDNHKTPRFYIEFIENIYDSIGSCGKCGYYSDKYKWCSRKDHSTTDDAFCSHFEKKS